MPSGKRAAGWRRSRVDRAYGPAGSGYGSSGVPEKIGRGGVPRPMGPTILAPPPGSTRPSGKGRTVGGDAVEG